jgi:amino acid adenylation domain-containing protein
MRNDVQTTAVAPTGLSAAKQALLSKWLRNGSVKHPTEAADTIPRRRSSGPVPLSVEQQRLWFFQQLEPHSALYTMPIALKLRGVLHPHALQQAMDLVVARHEALRTRFVGNEPAQNIDPPSPVPMLSIDLRHLPADQRDVEAKRLLEAEAKRPFDLTRDLMVRAALVRMDEQEWIFLVLMHHVASDDWSWRVFCSEVAVGYEAMIAGRKPELPEPALQYGDFSVWQKEWWRGETLEKHLAYWRKQLEGTPPVLQLPTDHPRPASLTFRGGVEWITLPPALSEKLEALSQRGGFSPFMILLAAFQTLLLRYTGQEDIVVGSPVAGRTRASLEKVIGLFVNMLVLRTKLEGNPSFAELLQRTQATVLEALSQQDLPFEKLVEELQPQRSASYSPLIQVMFALQDELSDNLSLPGLAAAPFPLDPGTAKFDLTFTIVKSGSRLDCCAEYNSELLEAATARRMLAHYEHLLQSIAADPGQRLSNLSLLGHDERKQLLTEWNYTEMDFPRDKCVHELVAAQAGATPDAVAVVCGSQSLTYRELDRRANQLANYLRNLGLGPESLVAIGMERSLEMMVALLGALKAGAAYVPLDPSYPAERLQFMLDDSRASILLTRSLDSFPISHNEPNNRTAAVLGGSNLNNQAGMSFSNAGTTSPIGRVRASSSDKQENIEVGKIVRPIHLDTDWPEISREPEDAPRVEMTPENLAYVIYTSGSTGNPKGVQIPHRAVVNFLYSMQREPGLASTDTLLSVTSVSFDIAALEFFLPLTVGARVALATKEEIFDAARMKTLLCESGATVMQATPSFWEFLVDAGWTGDRHLKILCGGEALSRELAEQLLTRGLEVWNLYGPTETTIWSTLTKLAPGKGPVSIGRPIANTQVFILDFHLQPVPVGVPGELYIGGKGVARGYLNQPELTAEKFISSPDGSPLYKTGDIARYRSDGGIECLGRNDFQIKLRGRRIDLGEIESALRRHPDVRDAVVSLKEENPGQKRLAAYVLAAAGTSPNTTSLQELLKSKLPDYMVPNAFVLLDKFPLTPNGKVDRKALSARTPGVAGPDRSFTPPHTITQETLAQIWRELLQVPRVGIHDNFFELGGHSLLAMQFLARVRPAFEAELTLRHIFEAPTIAELAVVLDRAPGQSRTKNSVSISPARRMSAERARELLSRLDQLSDAEVESLLQEVPADPETTL